MGGRGVHLDRSSCCWWWSLANVEEWVVVMLCTVVSMNQTRCEAATARTPRFVVVVVVVIVVVVVVPKRGGMVQPKHTEPTKQNKTKNQATRKEENQDALCCVHIHQPERMNAMDSYSLMYIEPSGNGEATVRRQDRWAPLLASSLVQKGSQQKGYDFQNPNVLW